MNKNHILTCLGRQHLLEPGAPYVLPSLFEIAHSLAQINRFTGHCRRPYSVAEHSLLVADTARYLFDAPPKVCLAALLHDAHECITGDVASPIKAVLGHTWRAFEDYQQTNLLHGFGLRATYREHYDLIKQCDLIALATERRDLMGYVPGQHHPWPVLDTPGQAVSARSVDLMAQNRTTRPWLVWADKFVDEFHALRDATDLTPPAQPTH